MTGTELYLKRIEPDRSHDSILFHIWQNTPWVVEVFTGPIGAGCYYELTDWCFHEFGHEAFLSHRSGRWRSGSATIMGWTWFGFSTREEMNQFAAAWPWSVKI